MPFYTIPLKVHRFLKQIILQSMIGRISLSRIHILLLFYITMFNSLNILPSVSIFGENEQISFNFGASFILKAERQIPSFFWIFKEKWLFKVFIVFITFKGDSYFILVFVSYFRVFKLKTF